LILPFSVQRIEGYSVQIGYDRGDPHRIREFILDALQYSRLEQVVECDVFRVVERLGERYDAFFQRRFKLLPRGDVVEVEQESADFGIA